jgi:hypothetical protein
MTVNFTMMAQNSDTDYIQQAAICAMSIKKFVPNSKICLITNDQVPERYKPLFTDVVEIPWEDRAARYSWKVQNRWKSYHACPYDSTIILDTDMLVLEDISSWWNYLQKYDLYFVSQPKTYRQDPVTSVYYRQAFVNHQLPNLYTGFHFFKKNDTAHLFYKWLDIVMNNWKMFNGHFAGGASFQKFLSMDVSAAIVAKILDWERFVTSKNGPYFIHMKAHAQNWNKFVGDSWQQYLTSFVTPDLGLYVGNYRQQGIFHYTEDAFLTESVIKKYEKAIGI